MQTGQKKFKEKFGITIHIPEGEFYHPRKDKQKHDLASILQNLFIDKIKELHLVNQDKLEEFRYLCESYFDYLNQTEDIIKEEEYERYI